MRPSATRTPTPHLSWRPGALGDVDAMSAIEQQSFSDPWPPSAFRDLISAAHARVSVAADERNDAVGYCVLLCAADEAEVANIAVAVHLRGRGVAARLLDDALEAAQSLGVIEVFLEVRMSNEAARALYRSRGFAQVGRRPAYYRLPTEDALVLRRELPSVL